MAVNPSGRAQVQHEHPLALLQRCSQYLCGLGSSDANARLGLSVWMTDPTLKLKSGPQVLAVLSRMRASTRNRSEKSDGLFDRRSRGWSALVRSLIDDRVNVCFTMSVWRSSNKCHALSLFGGLVRPRQSVSYILCNSGLWSAALSDTWTNCQYSNDFRSLCHVVETQSSSGGPSPAAKRSYRKQFDAQVVIASDAQLGAP